MDHDKYFWVPPILIIALTFLGFLSSSLITCTRLLAHKQPSSLTLQSSAKPITIRLYMNTEVGDHFAILAGDGTICYTTPEEWLTLILGANYTCNWRSTNLTQHTRPTVISLHRSRCPAPAACFP